MSVLKDIEIARNSKLLPINEVAKNNGIDEDALELYGKYKAKISYEYFQSRIQNPKGKLILVSAITPTPAGEGKTTTSIGLHDGLRKLGYRSFLALREPSLGPVFGVKGGATGGGYSQVLPMEDINLHFTGDIGAVEKAHNLIAAAVDNEINKGSIKLDLRAIRWRRTMDMNDRSLRSIIIGLGGAVNGYPRETGFDITASSEIMAILCLAESYKELKDMIGKILVGFDIEGKPIYARDLKVNGSAAALLKDAIKPNLVQTIEGNPVFIHGGPFANIAQGANSIIATKLALNLGDYAITEAGFAFELGAEKFFDLVSRKAGFDVSTVVLVATIRALKFHGGKKLKQINESDPDAVEKGFPNLEKHIENIRIFGTPAVVAINLFNTDTKEELDRLFKLLEQRNIPYAICEGWAKGSEGMLDLAKIVTKLANEKKEKSNPLYSLGLTTEEKIFKIASTMYGAEAVDYTPSAKKDLEQIKKYGFDNLPVCIAKTQKSLSDNPELLGRPKDFLVTVRQIEIASGAGFLIPITGDIMRMPGLPQDAAYKTIDIDDNGNIHGLF
ncbi:MAG: formate--tetrahydrofolate ligase [Spirochaetales bacterium]|jgi:formate--tetrahydrofolate ligase|nr:formate--tetrahydrofolate ligase [Exilispira sp.]NMC67687.1 formate--tetrahydrofolate ligase [Spirochaetales bacterium]